MMINLRATSVAAAIAICICWFMPWLSVDLPDMDAAFARPGEVSEHLDVYQSGQHIGGLAWLLLATAAGQAAAGWTRQWLLGALLAGGGALIAGYYLLAAGTAMRPALPIMAALFWGVTALHWCANKREGAGE